MARPDSTLTKNSRRVKQVASLSGRRYRKKLGLTRVEGPQALRELIGYAPQAIAAVYLSDISAAKYPQLLAHPDVREKTTITSHSVLSTMASACQDVVALVRVEQLRTAALPAQPKTVVVLPNTQDPGNMGTIIRLADAFAADAVFACAGGVDPYSPKVIRTSVGSIFHIPVFSEMSYSDVISYCKSQSMMIYGTGANATVTLNQCSLNPPLAWVFGNEAGGLTDSEIDLCDEVVAIPTPGKAESLNVAGAVTVCLYETNR